MRIPVRHFCHSAHLGIKNRKKKTAQRLSEEYSPVKTAVCLSGLFYGTQVQAYIISSLKKEMPSVFGKDSKKKELIANLGEIYLKIEKEHGISPGDFPNLAKMQVGLMS